MLKSNTLFCFALVIAVTMIGTHAWDTRSTKTNVAVVHSINRHAPPTAVVTCVQECLRVNPTNECVRACPSVSAPVVNAKPVVNPPDVKPILVVPSDVRPCSPVDANGHAVNRKASVNKKMNAINRRASVNKKMNAINRRAAVNKNYSKKKFVLVKAHHHKSKATHHHKSKSHGHHHGGHHHGGHGGHHHGGHSGHGGHGGHGGHSYSPGAHYSGCPG